MRHRQVAFAVSLCVATFSASASAQRPQDEVHASLELAGEVAARIESTFCNVNLARTFQGAINGINAMPQRSAEAPLSLGEDPTEDFTRVYGRLIESTEDRREIERAALNGMLHAYDASSKWMTSTEAYRYSARGGILVELDGSGPIPMIIDAFAGGPANLAGIVSGDRLIEVDGRPTEGLRLDEVVNLLRGEIDSEITVVVEREGAPITFTMRRALNTRPQVNWRIEADIGILTVEAFQENSAVAIRDAIRDIRRQVRQPAGYVLDLRNNAGGLLDQVIEAAGLFIDGGVVTTVRPFNECHPEDLQRYNARRHDETDGVPLVVLINRGTASGAELVAAALKERRHATLIGQASVGNAQVHTAIPIDGGRNGFLRLRTGVLTSPSGLTWDRTGLTPDIATQPRTNETDPTMERAIAILAGGP